MKAVFVQDGTEYRFEALTPHLVQGAPFKSRLSVKNQTSNPKEYQAILLGMHYLPKSTAAPETILQAAFQDFPWVVPPGAERTVSWNSEIPPNCPLGEKGSGVAFVFGRDAQSLQRMPCVVELHPQLAKIVQLLETLHQFPFRGAKSVKGWTELKFKPSESPRYSTVEELCLAAQFNDVGLQLKWKFKVKKFQASASTLSVGKAGCEVPQLIPHEELTQWLERADDRIILQYVDSALGEVGSNF